jgi:hypothetical protein
MDKGDFIDLMDSDDDDTEATKPATARKLVWMSTAQTVKAERAYFVHQPSCHLLQPTDSSAFRVPRRGLRISNFK